MISKTGSQILKFDKIRTAIFTLALFLPQGSSAWAKSAACLAIDDAVHLEDHLSGAFHRAQSDTILNAALSDINANASVLRRTWAVVFGTFRKFGHARWHRGDSVIGAKIARCDDIDVTKTIKLEIGIKKISATLAWKNAQFF